MIAAQREFKTIVKQSTWIAYAYKLVGLYSIPVLTLATIISMTNVYTSGNFARWPWVTTTWALIFAASIDVNIVRMFVEALMAHKQKNDLDKWIALSIGFGLMVVTGAALFLEGLQQSINLSWSDSNVKLVIGILIGLRVLFVIVLMAREGLKLGTFLYDIIYPSEPEINHPDTQKSITPEPVIEHRIEPEIKQVEHRIEAQINHPAPVQSNSVEVQKRDTDPLPKIAKVTQPLAPLSNTLVPVRKSVNRTPKKASKKARGNAADLVADVLAEKPDASINEIVNRTGISRGHVSNIRSQLRREIEHLEKAS